VRIVRVNEDAFFGAENVEVEEVIEIEAGGVEVGGFQGNVIAR